MYLERRGLPVLRLLFLHQTPLHETFSYRHPTISARGPSWRLVLTRHDTLAMAKRPREHQWLHQFTSRSFRHCEPAIPVKTLRFATARSPQSRIAAILA